MAKSKIVDFPLRTCAIGEASALWIVAVAHDLHDAYSFEYKRERQLWSISIKSSTFQGAAALVEKCRHILGWDIPADEKEAGAQ